MFFNFPILSLSVAALFSPVRDRAKSTMHWALLLGLFVAVIIITAADVHWSPYLLERYRMDLYFLMGIGCFSVLGLWYEDSQKKTALSVAIYALCAVTIVTSWLFYIGTVGVYYPDKLAEITQMLGI